MPALITQHGTGGKKQGQCDARCYNAKTPTCICCCGGANHGVGLQKAVENTRIMIYELERKAKDTGTKVQVKLPEEKGGNNVPKTS